MAYANIEPFGERQRDFSFGMLASVIANVNRDPKSKPSPFLPSDFTPHTMEDVWEKEAKKKSESQMNQTLLEVFKGIRSEQRRGSQDG